MKTAPPRPARFWRCLAGHALWLNSLWEAVQCAFFYDMSGVSWGNGIAFMVLATLADVALTCLLVAIALRLSVSFPRRAAPFLIALGGAASFGIEVFAQSAGWWRYSAAMPRIEIFGSPLGVLPLLQMAFLPLFAWILSDKERQ